MIKHLAILTFTASIGSMAFAFWKSPELGNSPFMSDRLKEGYKLSTDVKSVTPEGRVIALRETSSRKLLGSATRVCLPEGAATKSYYVTGFHVIDSVPQFHSESGEVLQLEMADSAMDLALLSGAKSSLPCLTLPRTLEAREVFDMEGAANSDLKRFDIEALNSLTGQVEQRSLNTVFVASKSFGMAAHSSTGPLLMINAFGLPGMSGGAVSSWMMAGVRGQDKFTVPNGWEMDLQTGQLVHARPTLVGMIKAVDAEGRQTALVPGSVIGARIRMYFADPKINGTVITERNSATQVELLESGATLITGTRLINSGLANLVNSGTGRLGDSGTGRLGDSGTGRLGDSGTGRLGDSDTSPRISRSSSGILLPQFPGRVWLTIGDDWSELEPLHVATRLRLKNPRSLNGIYLENGKLYSSNATTPLPQWIRIEESQGSGPGRYDLSEQERYQNLDSRELVDTPCVVTLATVRKEGSETLRGAVVSVCEWTNARGKGTSLTMASPNNSFKPTTVRIDLERNCEGNSTPCSLTLRSGYLEFDKFPFEAREQWLSWTSQHILNLKGHGKALRAQGLRSFSDERIQIQLEREGGYRIRIRGRGGFYIISGPTGDAVSQLQQYLASPGGSDEIARHFTNEAQKLMSRFPPRNK